jgi:hypothetical protein
MTTTTYKPGNYLVNGNKMYFDGTNWYDVSNTGVRTLNTGIDVNALSIASWTEPVVFPGGSVAVAVSYSYQGPTPTTFPNIHIEIGHTNLGIWYWDIRSDTPLTSADFAGNDGVTVQNETKTITIVIPTSLNASAPFEYSVYYSIGDKSSPTYDKAMKTAAPGYTNLTITAVTKVTTP